MTVQKKKTPNNIDRVLYLIQQSGTLMLMPRSHKKHLGTSFDTVASHTYQCCVIAYILSRMEGLTHEESLNAIGMALFHDLVEARTSDLDFIAKQYVKSDEEKAVKDQFTNLPFGSDLEKMIQEFEERKTLSEKCVKDADSLTQMYTEWVLMWQGNKLAEKWFTSDFNDRVPNMQTESAKKLAYCLRESNPNEWWWSEFMEEDAAKDIEKLAGKRVNV